MSETVSNRSLAVAAWTRLVRIQQRLDRASRRNFRSLGLSAAWFDVLARVGANEGLTQAELADSLLVTKGNVSQLLAKMEAAGLVHRRIDGRCSRVGLTDQGKALAAKALPRQEDVLRASLDRLSEAEQAELVRLLRKWEKS
jgi:DNA-binding MarR family transcriptional regulator